VRPSGINLRNATRADARLLFDWVNAPDSLAQKEHTAGPIPWQAHCAWLERKIDDPATTLVIIERAGAAVGQVRLEPHGAVHAIDIYVAPAARGRGIARAALLAALERAAVGAAVARVKAGNVASRGLFAAAGFSEEGREGEMVIYRLEKAVVHD